MPLDFPNSPSTNDTFTSGGITWKYDGAKWRLVTGSITAASASTITGSNAEGSSTSFARADHDHAIGAAEAWTAPTFQNSWANYGGGWPVAGYYKDHQNRVYLRGLIASGTRDAVAFTLPSGYRPEYSTIFINYSSGAYMVARVDVESGGDVKVRSENQANSNYISLDGISFRAA